MGYLLMKLFVYDILFSVLTGVLTILQIYSLQKNYFVKTVLGIYGVS